MTAPVNVALIGCGAVSEMLYAPLLASLQHESIVRVAALIDPSSDSAAGVRRILPESPLFANIDDALASVRPTLAIIAAPHRHHADISVRCSQGGMHVLCEKPMAVSTSDCDRMIEAATKAQRLLAVGHFRRFFPSCHLIKELLSSGLLGAPRSFSFLEGEIFSWMPHSASFLDRRDAGGGVLIDSGAHTLDLLRSWLGDVEEADYEDDAMGGIEANCVLRLRMRNGATGVVQLSRDWPLPNRYHIECERGWVAYSGDVADRVEWGMDGMPYTFDAGLRQPDGAPAPGFIESFAAQLQNVLDAIHGRARLVVPGTEARETVALIESCYRNRRLIEMPWLSPAEREEAVRLANV